jgi:biopolymer transport protein ExbD
VFIGDFRTDVGTMGEDLNRLIGTRNPTEERIFIRSDRQTRYGDFMQVMNALQDNGYYSVALVGEDTAS